MKYTNAYIDMYDAAVPHATVNELFAFIGLHVYVSIDYLPQLHMYWSHNYTHTFITRTMSRDRFKQLLRYFVVNDPANDDHILDPAAHTAPFITHLNQSFPLYLHPSRFLTLDEFMVAYKGDADIRQFIPSKPHRFGYKVYGVASDNYVLKLELYQGAANKKSERGATYDLVMRMLSDYHHRHHVVFMDNWFTSPTVLRALAECGVAACGSVRLNRVGMPSKSLISKPTMKNMHRHECLQFTHDDMTLAVWKDRSVVKILYNYVQPNAAPAHLSRYDQNHNEIAVSVPQAIHDYFYHARSVDVVGQLRYSYPIWRKAKRRYPALVWWLIDICIVNAFVLWSNHHPAQTHLKFREILMYEMTQQHHEGQAATSATASAARGAALTKEHYADHAETEGDCKQCTDRSQKRVRSRYICAACNVHLCIGKCFSLFHA